MNLNSVKDSASTMWGKHGSTVLLVGGIAAMAGAAIFACVKSVKEVPVALEEEKEAIAEAKQTGSNPKIVRQAVISAAKIGRHYAFPVAIFSIGGAMVVMARQQEHGRFVAASAAYNTLLGAFSEYRNKVIEREGVEQDRRYIHGEEEIEVVEERETKNGKKRKHTEKKYILGSGNSQSIYHRFWGRKTSTQWTTDPMYNLSFIKAVESNFNNKLQAKGYVLLSDVYEALGLELEGRSTAAMVGWILGGGGDDYIDFGLYSPTQDIIEREGNLHTMMEAALKESIVKSSDEINYTLADNEASFWLDFNCDGIIIDRI